VWNIGITFPWLAVVPAHARLKGLGYRQEISLRAAAAALIAGLLTLAGCAGSSGSSDGASTSGTRATTVNVFSARHQVSLGQLNAEVGALYIAHPALTSFSAQDVSYTTKSRQAVLRECTTPGPAGSQGATGSQQAETGQIVACAPLIFYYYYY
jgi:hypothetical protein